MQRHINSKASTIQTPSHMQNNGCEVIPKNTDPKAENTDPKAETTYPEADEREAGGRGGCRAARALDH